MNYLFPLLCNEIHNYTAPKASRPPMKSPNRTKKPLGHVYEMVKNYVFIYVLLKSSIWLCLTTEVVKMVYSF